MADDRIEKGIRTAAGFSEKERMTGMEKHAKKKHKYFNQLFFTYSAAFLLFLTLVFGVALSFIYREQYSRNVEIHSQLVSQVQSQLDSSLEKMDRIVNGLLFNRSFMEIMADSGNVSNSPLYYNEVLNYFLTLDAPDISTYRIIAFNEDTYYTLTKSDENPAYIREAADSYAWKSEILAAKGEKVILPVHTDSFSSYGAPVYSVTRAITDGRNEYGIIEVQNEYSNIEEMCSLENVSGEVLLFSSDGSLLYPWSKEDSASPEVTSEKYEDIYETVTSQNASGGSFRQESTQLSYATSDYSGWTVVLSCPVLSLVPFGVEAITLTIFVFLVLIGIVLILFRVLTRRLVAPLNDLNSALSEVSLDNLSLELSHRYNIEEIESINQSFQKMFCHLKKAINVSIQSRANEERASYLALQSQMNPHTIYNTISMIECVAYMNGDMEASELCIRFSKMLRYISDFTKDTYTVADELTHLKNYAFLIQKRYDGTMDIHVTADDILLGETLPKFTLQPLAENCVKHGFRSSNTHFIVRVAIAGTPADWTIRITDNGSGFSQESLEQIRKQLEKCEQDLANQNDIVNRKIGSLAVSNIYIRCRILYRSSFHFSFGNNTDGPGAFVEIHIRRKE